MWTKVIEYFSKHHMLTNFIMIGAILGGIFFWFNTNKEELPDITFDFVRVSASYPGAAPEDVEQLVTKPLEEQLEGIDGIYLIESTSSQGSCSIRIELDPDYDDKEETVTEIKNAVLEVNLPDDVRDDPRVRQFKTSKKAIIDIAVIDKSKHLLDYESRKNLQRFVHVLENQLTRLPEINSVDRRSGYLQEEIQIKLIPEKLLKYNIPFNTVMNEIKKSHIRQPAGSIENLDEPKVTLISELDNVKDLENLIIQGGFEGQAIRLEDIATVQRGFEKLKSITKINGHEGVYLQVVKNSRTGILKAIEKVKVEVEMFKKNCLKDCQIELVYMDDESESVRNRLSIVSNNGIIGFILIIITLLIFLNFRSAMWVAMGIPFTFCFTMIMMHFMGYTINKVTLAAVIIVMGMIVDDAIVVSENIMRLQNSGMPEKKAVVVGTVAMFLPIIASILTTCAAFLPMFFFTGRMARFIENIPPIIFLMLGGSLFESIFILPSHLSHKVPRFLQIILTFGTLPLIEKYILKVKYTDNKKKSKTHWFFKVEEYYGNHLGNWLKYKYVILLIFVLLLLGSFFLFSKTMKFVMFPREEVTQVNINAEAPEGTNKYETAELAKQIENVLMKYEGKEVTGISTSIAVSRRGGAVEENKASIRVEIVSREERKKTSKQLMAEWQKQFKNLKGFNEIKFSKRRFGQSSGSPIVVEIRQNDDIMRRNAVNELFELMKKNKELMNVEIERSLRKPEYKVYLKKDKIKRLGINPQSISSTLRAILEGTVLYEFSEGNEEIDVKVTSKENAKDNLYKVLNVPVENQANYLVPLNEIVTIEKSKSDNSIKRKDSRRMTTIYADMAEKTKFTPVEIAEYFEQSHFPNLGAKYPGTILEFAGEVEDTRESGNNFLYGVLMVILLIYIILALLFSSLTRPLIIMMTIIFGTVGIILAFFFHGKLLFGFFAAIGALGLAGVVVNDSIVMMVKLDEEYKKRKFREMSEKQIANIAKTRLRAVILTTVTTVAGLIPTAYGFAGYDSMLSEMMLALSWGLMFGTFITLLLVPVMYSITMDAHFRLKDRLKIIYKRFAGRAG